MKYDIVSDIHGCYNELCELLEKAGYKKGYLEHMYLPPDDTILISVGDLTDRGPDSVKVIKLLRNMRRAGEARIVCGNHDDRLLRWAKGNKVQLSHGLDITVKDIENSDLTKEEIINFISILPYYLLLDGGDLAIVHASWADKLAKRDPYHKKCRYRCLFGPNNGVDDSGMVRRIDWVKQRIVNEGSPWVVYGHQVQSDVRHLNRTYGIDTGCVFGKKLTMLRWPSKDIIQVNAHEEYCKYQWGEIK